jgi:hypothetical protein
MTDHLDVKTYSALSNEDRQSVDDWFLQEVGKPINREMATDMRIGDDWMLVVERYVTDEKGIWKPPARQVTVAYGPVKTAPPWGDW